MLSTILIILLVLAVLGGLPTWGYSSNWGYGPSGFMVAVLLLVLILRLMGKL